MKQPGETEIEHRLMMVYFDLGMGRDFSTLSARTSLPIARIRDISEKCKWDERLLAYGKYLDATVSALFNKQIATDAAESQKGIISMIRSKVGFLQQKTLADTSDYSVNDLLEQIMRLCRAFDMLSKRSFSEDSDKAGRAINIMFSPVIETTHGAVNATAFEVTEDGEQKEEGQEERVLSERP